MGTPDVWGLRSSLRVALQEDRDVPPISPDSWIRVSGIAGLCAREEALCSRSGKIRKNVVGPDLSVIFEHGHALHWGFQNRILPRTGALLGRWLCAICGTFIGGAEEWVVPLPDEFQESQVPRPEECPNCGVQLTSENSLFREQLIKHPEYRLTGHTDGFLRMPGMPGLGVFELKSISPKGAYEVRNCAKMDHVVQVQCYMWLVGARWGRILYFDKGASGMRGLVEHFVEYDEDHVEAIQNLVRDVLAAGEDGSKLPDPICASPDCKRAEMCSVVRACFDAS